MSYEKPCALWLIFVDTSIVRLFPPYHIGFGISMRIAYLIPSCELSGGIAVVCQHVNRLKNRGHNVVLISETNDRTIDWFPNHNVKIIGLQDVPSDLDILVATAWSTAFSATVVPAKKKFYFVQSDETRFHPKSSAWEHITRLSYTIGFNYLTEARWIKNWLWDNFGHDAELVPNGLDSDLFFPADPCIAKGRKPRILLEGAIGLPYKGMKEAFEAVQSIDAEIWCVSSYGKPDKSWKCDRFFGIVPMAEMKHVYSSCDILLKLSRVEGFFGPPMEMMACGGVAVVGRVTGYDEYIEDGVNALVVDPTMPLEAKLALQRLINEPELVQKLIENGKRTVEQWRWEPSIDILEQFFIEVSTGTRGVEFSPPRADLAQSITYFYQLLSGKKLLFSFNDSAHNAKASDLVSPGGLIDSSEKDSQLFDISATETLLDWLRTKRSFRSLAKIALLLYNKYSFLRRWSKRFN